MVRAIHHLTPRIFGRTSELYTIADIKDIFNTYVAAKQLVNPHEQQYINIADDDALARAVSTKSGPTPEFLKRDDALRMIRDHMQAWYELATENIEPIRKYVVFLTATSSLIDECSTGKGRLHP